ncbi:TrkH family potassium uptake protein [Paucidesulfovibrio longus]|uniref:TrkH family potassium uptake protein n=1 Tax=Paucidesulfovibrio longus TaxID=889 RepID=UPI0003B71A80|nr:potassium transporter TrkG [Paucidesulfovibrio longus]
MRSKLLTPFWLPVWFFIVAILVGGFLLHLDTARMPGVAPLSRLDALFTATSAVCVTGLVVVDTGSYFTTFGQGVILVLIQLGGLGVMTYSSLVFFLLGRRVSLTDRLAVSKTLLHDPSFKLSQFLVRVVIGTLFVESVGALTLYALDPVGFGPWSALFHSVSAFCNAGFGLYQDSLMQWRTNWGVNLAFIILITLGGLGFYVLHDCSIYIRKRIALRGRITAKPRLSWHTGIVLSTSLFLVAAGTVAIFAAEEMGGYQVGSWSEALLSALFQSVSCRTAGFNTVDIGGMTNVSLLFMIGLMFVGGSPGSCAGGVKTTTARVMWGFIVTQFRGGEQVRVGRFALDRQAMSRAFTLVVLAGVLVCAATLALNITEGGDAPHDQARGIFLETMFEAMSAFGTVGLTTGMTGTLSPVGRTVGILLMMVGRLGPIWLLSALASWQELPRYQIPEKDLPLG